MADEAIAFVKTEDGLAVTDPADRFTGRATAYAATRPTYPPSLVTLLGLRRGDVVCDLGSGTGIFSRLLLDAGATVYAVEPNEDMRSAAEGELGDNERFHSVAGRAEATTLPDGVCDLVTAAQSFHWFDAERGAPHPEAEGSRRARVE
jgi:SAM-dependent methyltransferase